MFVDTHIEHVLLLSTCTHTHMHVCVYIYIYMCVCVCVNYLLDVCVCVILGALFVFIMFVCTFVCEWHTSCEPVFVCLYAILGHQCVCVCVCVTV
jgi:hypothetical protein